VGKISFMCPLCGLHHSIGKYEPDDLPLDILAIERVGLGRGRGTKIVGRHSLLWDDEVSQKIVDRTLTLCKYFLDCKRINLKNIEDSIGIRAEPSYPTVSLKEYNKLLEDTEALKAQLEEERRRSDIEQKKANKLQLELERILIIYNKLLEEKEALKSQAEEDRQIINSLKTKINRLENQLNAEKTNNRKLIRTIEDYDAESLTEDDELDEIIETIENETNNTFDSHKGSKKGFIIRIFKRLIEDVEALEADEDE
jgi:DNA repair exonuclease SbcCD ATPase subunit